MDSTVPPRDLDLDRVLACRTCGYPFVRFFKDGRRIERDPSLRVKRILCPDCAQAYLRAEDGPSYHLEGEPSERMEILEVEEWRHRWRRPPLVFLDTFDDYGRHVWLRVSRSLVQVLKRRPGDAFSILASQRPGAFDPESVRFVCWHNDDFAPGEYRIAELLLAE